MKQSKLLKKSLAALLAILMVAAMIPMSAFAASAPEGVTAIRVNGTSATWDGEKYVVKAEGQRSPATVSMSAVVSSDTTHVFLKEADEGQLDTSTGLSGVKLSDAAEKPEPVGTTGTYKFTLLIGASRNTNTPYQLEIQWTETFASRDTGIKAVHNIPNMVGDAVVADGVITIKTKLGTTAVESAIFEAVDNATVVTSSTPTKANQVKIALSGDNKGKFIVSESDGGSGYAFGTDAGDWTAIIGGSAGDAASKVRATLLPAIFEPNTTEGVTMDLAGDTLTVNANGATEKYTLKFVSEDTFTEIKLGDAVGTIDDTAGTITFEFPYDGDVTTELQLAAVVNGLPLTFKTVSGVTLSYNSNTITSGTKAVTFASATGDGVLKVDTNSNSKNVTVSTVSGGTATFNLIVTAPNASPVAALTAIKIGNSQVVNIEKGQTTVDVTLPAGTSLSTAQIIKVAGLKGTKVDVLGDAGQKVTYVDNNVTKDGIENTGVLAPFNGAVKISDKVVYLKVTSPDGKTVVNYTINVKVGTASGIPTLTKLNLVNKVTGDVIATGTINQTSRKVEMTIPYSIAKDGGDWSDIVVVAEASDFASVAFATSTSFSGSTELVSGETEAMADGGLFGDNAATGFETNNTTTMAVIRLWTGTSISSAEYPVDYDVVPKSAEVGKQNQVTSAEFTTASKKEDMTAENTFKADVDRDKHIIKVYLPYSVNAELVAGTKTLRLSALGISDFAVLAQVGASAGDVAATGESVDDYSIVPGATALGNAIDVKANWNDYLNEDGTLKTANVVTLRTYSEEQWDKIAGKSIVADNATPQTTEIKAGEFNGKATSQAYSLVAEVEKAETGYALESIESTVDTNVTVSGDVKDASHELTLNVPYSYYRNSDKTFTLNYTASPKATVKINNVELTSDAGSADTKGASKFSFIDGHLAVNGTKLAPNGGPYVITVTAEDGKHSDSWKLSIAQIAAQSEASLKGLTVGKAAGVQDTEDETKWTVTVPNGSNLEKQVLSFETVSPLATVRIGSDDFDPSKEYNLTNPITFTVVAEDGVNRKVYTLTATEGEPSTEADITAAKVGEVEATIAGETITAVVAEDFDFTQAVAVSFEVSEGAKVTKLGEAAPTETYTFTDGEAVAVEVTAQDGKTTKTYQLVVTTKKPSSENTITELTVDGIAATIAEEAITAEAENPASVTLDITLPEGAIAKVGDVEYTAGMTVDATEAVTIVVTAEDGTEKTYTLTVTKKAEQPKPGLDDVNDVPADHWAAEAIADILSRGIMTPNSKGNFRPNETVSRGMFAVMMCQLYGVNPEDYADAENPYTDIKKGDWFYNAALAAVANDWMTGTSSTTFSPKEPVTREQTALIIAKAQGLSKVEAPAELYSDDAQIASWAKGWVYACKDADLISYMSASQKTFNPKGDLTRAQIATILTKIHPDTEKPDEPENPDEGNNPENPDEGNNPENPDEGNNPENPDEGNTPENPDEGNNPENPDEGNNPENPDEGSNPENPDEGNTPENPDEGNTPETPDEGETPAE